MLRKFIKVCVLISLSIFNIACKDKLPDFDKDYFYLSSNKVNSDNYMITKLIDGEFSSFGVKGHVLYDSVNNVYVLKKKNANIFYKISNNKEVDSIVENEKIAISFGLFFGENYYVDWLFTGEKRKKKYAKIIEDNNFSTKEFEELYKKASLVAYRSNLNKEKGYCYFYINDEWVVLMAENYYSKIKYNSNLYIYEMQDYPPKIKNKLIYLKDEITGFYDWKDEDSKITNKGFLKENKEHKFLLDYNNASQKGYSGLGYFQIKYDKELLKFKTYTFSDSYDDLSPDISLYENNRTIFIELNKGYHSKRDSIDRGFYIIRKR